MELPTHFQTFLANIEPTTNQKRETSNANAVLRQRLREDDCMANFQGSFLAGSFGRDTATRSTKTADIIIVANYNKSFWEPHLALSHLKRILAKDYKTITVQAGFLQIPLSSIDLNIVPAITEERLLKIPDRAAHKWVPSNSHRHIQLSAAMDTSKKGLYRPLIKALKCWRDYKLAKDWKPKSFLLECLIYDYAEHSTFNSVPKAIEGFLWYNNSKYKTFQETHECAPFVREIGAPETNIAKDWPFRDFSSFIDEVHRSWILSHQAVEAQSKIVSVDRWHQLFGDAFPKDT